MKQITVITTSRIILCNIVASYSIIKIQVKISHGHKLYFKNDCAQKLVSPSVEKLSPVVVYKVIGQEKASSALNVQTTHVESVCVCVY